MERASDHALALSAAVDDFFAKKPYELIHEFDPDPGKELWPPRYDGHSGLHLYRVDAMPVPDQVSILAGDVLRDLRSALDYLAWQLALDHSDPPPHRTEFPIHIDEAAFQRERKRQIGGIDPALYPRFEAVQPFNAVGNAAENPLWILHRLANEYKHRAPKLVSSLPMGVGVEEVDGVDFSAGMKMGPFSTDDVVLTLGILGGTEPTEEIGLDASFVIAFDGGDQIRPPLMNEINGFGSKVAGIIKWFRDSLPS